LNATAKDIHDIIDQSCRMAFTRCGYVADTIQFRPEVGRWIIRPYIVEPSCAVSATKEKQLVLPGDNGMICSRRGERGSISAIWNENFPVVARSLERVQVKGDQVVEKVTFDLTAIYVNLGSDYI
jgi:hypothetical protein